MIKKIEALPEEFKKLKSEKIIFGQNNVLKALKLGKVKSVVFTLDTPKNIKKEIETQAELSNSEVNEISVKNKELGMICRRPHGILMIALLN